MKMDRRAFVKTLLISGAAAASVPALASFASAASPKGPALVPGADLPADGAVETRRGGRPVRRRRRVGHRRRIIRRSRRRCVLRRNRRGRIVRICRR
jgi:hypothetical protein